MRERVAPVRRRAARRRRGRRRLPRRRARLPLGGAGVIRRAGRRRPGAGARRLPDDPGRPSRTSRSSARPPTAREAVELAARARPDVVLMDIRMPVLDGLAATRRIVADPDCATRVLVLTTFDLDEYVFEALRAGASGFLLKDAPAERARAGDPTSSRRRRAAGAGGHPAADRASSRPGAATPTAVRGRASGSPTASARCSASSADGLIQRRDRRRAGRSARPPSRPTWPASSPSSALRDRVQAVVMAYRSGLAR